MESISEILKRHTLLVVMLLVGVASVFTLGEWIKPTLITIAVAVVAVSVTTILASMAQYLFTSINFNKSENSYALGYIYLGVAIVVTGVLVSVYPSLFR